MERMSINTSLSSDKENYQTLNDLSSGARGYSECTIDKDLELKKSKLFISDQDKTLRDQERQIALLNTKVADLTKEKEKLKRQERVSRSTLSSKESSLKRQSVVREHEKINLDVIRKRDSEKLRRQQLEKQALLEELESKDALFELELKSRTDEFSKQIAALEVEHESQRAKLVEKNDELRESMEKEKTNHSEELKSCSTQLEQMDEVNRDLSSQLTTCLAQLEHSRGEISRLNDLQSRYQADLEKKKHELQRQIKKGKLTDNDVISSLQADICRLKEEGVAHVHHIANLQEQIKSQNANHEKAFEQDRTALKATNNKLRADYSDLETEMRSANRRVEELEGLLEDAVSSVSNLKAQVFDLETQADLAFTVATEMEEQNNLLIEEMKQLRSDTTSDVSAKGEFDPTTPEPAHDESMNDEALNACIAHQPHAIPDEEVALLHQHEEMIRRLKVALGNLSAEHKQAVEEAAQNAIAISEQTRIVHELRIQVDTIESENVRLSAALAVAQSKVDELELQVGGLTLTCSQLESQVVAAEDSVRTVSAELDVANKLATTADSTQADVTQQMKQEIRSLKTNLTNAEWERKSAREAMADANAKADEAIVQIDDLRASLALKDSELLLIGEVRSTLEAALEVAEATNLELTRRLEEVELCVEINKDESDVKLEEAEKKYADLKAAMADKVVALEALEVNVALITENFTKESEERLSLQNEVAKLRSVWVTLESDLRAAQESLCESKEEVMRLSTALEKTRDDLRAKEDELLVYIATAEVSSADFDQHQKQLETEQAARDQLKVQVNSLAQAFEAAQLRATHAEIESARVATEFRDYQMQFSPAAEQQLRLQTDDLTRELSELRRQFDSRYEELFAAQHTESERLKEELAARLDTCVQLQGELNAKSSECLQLKEAFTAQSVDFMQLKQERDAIRCELDDLQVHSSLLKGTVSANATQLAGARESIEISAQAERTAREELLQVHAHAQSLTSRISQLEGEVQQHQYAHDSLLTEVESERAKYSQQIVLLEAHEKSLAEELATLTGRVQRLSESEADQQGQIEHLKAVVSMHLQSIDGLTADLESKAEAHIADVVAASECAADEVRVRMSAQLEEVLIQLQHEKGRVLDAIVEAEAMETQLADMQARYTSLAELKVATEAELADVREKHSLLNEDYSCLEAHLEERERDHEADIEALDNSYNDILEDMQQKSSTEIASVREEHGNRNRRYFLIVVAFLQIIAWLLVLAVTPSFLPKK